jgi:hypothetical protein
MSNIRPIDMMVLDDLFDMNGGYVLNFSDRTFTHFFADELNIDIDNPAYAKNGSSKAKRLRCSLQTVDKPTVVRTLNALWEYREVTRERFGQEEKLQNPHGRLLAILDRLGPSSLTGSHSPTQPAPTFDRAKFSLLQADLISLSKLDPQPRGFAFRRTLAGEPGDLGARDGHHGA